MKVLFLDDNQNRISEFIVLGHKYFDEQVIVKTAKEAIQQLQTNTFDYVLLDHDLGGKVFQDSNEENTGMEVVRWIIQNHPTITQIIVHSWNAPASMRMAKDLIKAGYNTIQIPFGLGLLKVTYM